MKHKILEILLSEREDLFDSPLIWLNYKEFEFMLHFFPSVICS